MKDFCTKSRVFTVLALLVSVTGMIGPEVTAISPGLGKIVGIIGLIAAACGHTLTAKHPDMMDASTFDVNRLRSVGLLAIALPILALTFITTGCDNSQKKAVDGASVVASADSATIDIKHDLREQGAIDSTGELEITRAQIDFNDALTEVNDKVLCSASDPNARQNLIAALQKADSSLSALLQKGALHIKNPQLKEKFSVGLIAAGASLRVIQIFINKIDTPSELPPDVRATCDATSAQLKDNAKKLDEDLTRLNGEQSASGDQSNRPN